MAAEAIASVVLERLASVALNKLEEHFQLVTGAKDEVKKLTKSFQAIQALLYDAEIKKITNETANAGVTLWLQRFSDVAYKMDDIIDQWITETLISQIGNDGASSSNNNNKKNKKMGSYFSSCCSCFGEVALRHEIGSKIKELRKELDDIISDKDKLSLNISLPAATEHPVGERLPTSSIIDESEIFGRDEDKKMISSMLLEANTPTNPFIISIIGMGGLGKTTLAQLVFNEDGIKSYFQKSVIWVSVSDYFDQTRIAKEIIRGVGDHVPEHLSEWNDELHKCLCESIKKKRFLLVLDDMWTDSPEDVKKWELFRVAFKNAAQGSRILVTTRKQSVADMIDSHYSHLLDVLSEKYCWELLSRLAFQGKNADKVHNEAWIKIGKEIANKCKGVPLSAKVLGNLLRVKEDIINWQTVMDNEFIWKLENGILKPALLLSYYDLPPAVRACFVYCAIFPKGHEIRKDELIGMWMAQGLIMSSGGEAVGKEYFNRLAAQSFFQNFVQGWDGNIIHCDMHDLVHDFAQFLTKGEYVTLSPDSSSNTESLQPRHLSIFSSEDSFNPDSLLSSISSGEKNLRTFILLNRSTYLSPLKLKTILPDLLGHLRYLRVLVIRNSDLECLPSEIEKLIHLRYLDLSYNQYLTELPDSLCILYNLQTLDVTHCSRLGKLPEELGRMINLRHLRFKKFPFLACLPQGIGNLTSLHTLTEFRIQLSGGTSSIRLLKKLNQLEGHLSIYGLDVIQSSSDAYEAMLNKKKKLQSLLFNFAVIKQIDLENFKISPVETVGDVLAALEPPSLLGILKIESYRGSKFPNWIAMLPNLRELELDGCNCVELPALGDLPSLEYLSIQDMHQLKHIGPEFYGVDGHRVAFPQLKTLRIAKAHGLVHFTMPSSSFPLLGQVDLNDCINLKALPAFGRLPSLEYLDISGLYNVKHIGTEFYGNGSDSAPFPRLKTLRIEGARILEEWDAYATQGMTCLRELELDGCGNLKALPAFGKLPSLECLKISDLHNVTHIGKEFYGDGADSVPFPKLKQLQIYGAHILEEWTFGPEGVDVMPYLGKLELYDCGLKALPALGKLGSLKDLKIRILKKLKHIGSEFYDANRVAFPQLQTLEISEADSLEEWAFGAGDHEITVMPCLRQVDIHGCGALKKLPALGRMQSLETLSLLNMNSLKEIGNEFYGGNNNLVSFPNLISLSIEAAALEVWAFGTDAQGEKSDAAGVNMIRVMPRVRYIYLEGLKLKTLPALGKLPCLETLWLSTLDNVEHLGPEFYGDVVVTRTDQCEVDDSMAVFPKLYQLTLYDMKNLKWWEPGSRESSMCSIMPCLRDLTIYRCSYLKSLPQHLSNTLVSLTCYHLDSKIPPRLGQLEALQHLDIGSCSWEYMPTEIQDMHNLRTLVIEHCRDLEATCTGDGWKMISHIPNIRIGDRIMCGHF